MTQVYYRPKAGSPVKLPAFLVSYWFLNLHCNWFADRRNQLYGELYHCQAALDAYLKGERPAVTGEWRGDYVISKFQEDAESWFVKEVEGEGQLEATGTGLQSDKGFTEADGGSTVVGNDSIKSPWLEWGRDYADA